MCRTAFGLALLGVTLVLVGCGGDAAALDPVAQAADKSAQAGTYRFDLVLVTDLGRATGHGAGDRSSSDTTIDFGPAFSDTGNPEKLRTVFDQRAGRLDMYVYLPELAADLTPGKRWVKFDMLRELRWQGLTRGDLFTTALQTPSTYLEALRAAHQHVDDLGKGDLDGVPASHYRVRLTLDDVIDAAPPEKRAALRRFIGTDTESVESDIWVSEDGLIRRTAERFEGDERAAYTLTFHDWGAPFTLHLPPARLTADGNKFFAKAGP